MTPTQKRRKQRRAEQIRLARETAPRLTIYRNSLGESPEVFAARLGMTKRAYMAYERAERTGWGWNRMIWRFVRSGLPISFDWLICGDGPMNRGNPRPMLRVVEGGACHV